MSSMNKVILIGNLGADPEIKTFQNGGKIANLRIATSQSWKDRATGERKERTEWHSISIQNEGLVGIAERFLRKGSKVAIEGELRTRKWQDQAGNDRYSTEVVLAPFNSSLTMLDTGNRDGGSGGGDRGSDRGGQSGGGSSWDRDRGQSGGGSDWGRQSSGGSTGGGFGDDLDDDIPF